jgi:double zinc ribbon protein
VYFALIVWTYMDARRRITDPLLVTCATAASLFPFFGSVVYLILRPPEFIEDAHEREIEMAAAEARLMQLNELSCQFCHHPIERAFLRCPNCHRRLKEPCAACAKPLDPRWRICPYCEHEVGQPPPARRTKSTTGTATRAVSGERPAAKPQRAASRPRQAPPDGGGADAPTRSRPRPSAG